MTSPAYTTKSYDWGSVTPYSARLRSHELVARVRWFIQMRWIAVFMCAAGSVAAYLHILSTGLNPLYFAVITVFLVLTNLAYTIIARRLLGDENRHHSVQLLLLFQMGLDFLALSALAYACGTIETPLITLFMAHIILATLFFTRTVSLAVAGAAFLFAALPLMLEFGSIIPMVTIFKSNFKSEVLFDPKLSFTFVGGIGTTFLVCWYLVSEISASLKLREKQLEDAYEMLLRIDREKSQATLRATHELKAPFAAIKSYVYTLQDGYLGELPEKARNAITRIGDRCDRLTEKITDIIHLSNLRTVVLTDMAFSLVDVNQVLAEETREGALVGEHQGISVVLTSPMTTPAWVLGSRTQLSTMFSNLIRNAIQYSFDNGRVEVSLGATSKQICVSIRDHGIGIPEANLDKIFEEHFRSNNAVAHFTGGTGLGLPIVKEIARLHGATIQVESILGKGSVFTVCFEVKEEKIQERLS